LIYFKEIAKLSTKFMAERPSPNREFNVLGGAFTGMLVGGDNFGLPGLVIGGITGAAVGEVVTRISAKQISIRQKPPETDKPETTQST